MATVKQLLKLQQQVEDARKKLDTYGVKRKELIQALGLKFPSLGERRCENFVVIDGEPTRLWVGCYGEIEVERLKF